MSAGTTQEFIRISHPVEGELNISAVNGILSCHLTFSLSLTATCDYSGGSKCKRYLRVVNESSSMTSGSSMWYEML